MKVLVLGIGNMGEPLVRDLVDSNEVSEIVAGDIDIKRVTTFLESLNSDKVSAIKIDATKPDKLVEIMKDGYDVVADTLNYRIIGDCRIPVLKACIEAGVSHVDVVTFEGVFDLDKSAKDANVTIIPGCGLDPGIDRILIGRGARMMDKVEKIHMYCGGFPQKNTSVYNHPLRYGITFTWTSVIKAVHGKAKIIMDGKPVMIDKLENPEIITFPEPVGECEAWWLDSMEDVAKGLNLPDVKESWGKTVRWKGYCDLFKKLIDMQITSFEPLNVKGVEITPRDFLIALGNKTMHYKEGEGDVVVERVEVIGKKNDEDINYTATLVDLYDMETKTSAMGRTTAYTCSIISQMIARGDITEKGVIHPAKIGYDEKMSKRFFSELIKKKINITETITTPLTS